MCQLCEERDHNVIFSLIPCKLITKLPSTLINLDTLCIYRDHLIESIPSELVNIDRLYIRSLKIKQLPKTLVKIRNLDISYTLIDHIPKEYTRLEMLYCSFTFIKELPKLPNLRVLFYKCSQIRKLDLNHNLYTEACDCIYGQNSHQSIIQCSKNINQIHTIQRIWRQYKFRKNMLVYKTMNLPYVLFRLIMRY